MRSAVVIERTRTDCEKPRVKRELANACVVVHGTRNAQVRAPAHAHPHAHLHAHARVHAHNLLSPRALADLSPPRCQILPHHRPPSQSTHSKRVSASTAFLYARVDQWNYNYSGIIIQEALASFRSTTTFHTGTDRQGVQLRPERVCTVARTGGTRTRTRRRDGLAWPRLCRIACFAFVPDVSD